MDIRIASQIVSQIEKIADSCELRGAMEEAYQLDIIANTIEKQAAGQMALQDVPAEAKELAKELGVNLTLDNALDIIQKYYNPNMPKEAAAGGKMRQWATLAAMLAGLLTSQAEAGKGVFNMLPKGQKEFTIDFPTGAKTYTLKELKDLMKSEPKSGAIAMERLIEQLGQKQQAGARRERNIQRSQQGIAPGSKAKPVVDTEREKDQYGNISTLITYQDGSKELEGDHLVGGVSYRKMLEKKGEIPKGGGEYAKPK